MFAKLKKLTWGRNPISILWCFVIQRLKHRPHSEDKHGSQEAIEDQVKEEDET